MTIIDRFAGVSSGLGRKAPVRVATTANITLSGEQTIDGVAVVSGDRVLVRAQTTGSQNGIYDASTGNWTRSLDFDGSGDVVSGTAVLAVAGTVGAGVEFYLSTTGTITIGSTSLTFPARTSLPIPADTVANSQLADMAANTVKANITGSAANPTDVTKAAFITWLALVAANVSDFSEAVDDRVAALLTAGTGITLTYSDAGGTLTIARELPRGYLNGFTLSNNGSDAVNDIDIAAGAARDSTDAKSLIGSAMTKRLDAAWAAGTNQGGRFPAGAPGGSPAWYHVFAIYKDSDGSVDYGLDTSISAANKPAGYSYFVRLGSVYWTGSTIRAFTQVGRRFFWAAPTLDVDTSTLSTSSTSFTLLSPTGVQTLASCNVYGNNGGGAWLVYVRTPSMTDTAPSASAAPLATIAGATSSQSAEQVASFLTDTSAQVAARASVSSTVLRIATLGWLEF